MTFEHIEVSNPAENVTRITLNRPRQFNALAEITFRELTAAVSEFETSGNKVMILTGAGRAFCFGADFLEFQDPSRLPGLLDQFQSLILKIHHCEKPTIASLNGFATGAGMDLALACDFRIASDRVKLGEAYIGMGLVSDGGGSYFLPRMIGASRALQLLLTGDSLDATQAQQLGLVNDVCPADALPAKTLEFAQAIASKPSKAMAELKKLVRKNAGADLATALQNERAAQLECFEDPQHQALVREFIAKRQK